MKVVFLDRDGVINEYPGDTRYVTCWQEFKFILGSIEAIRKFNEYNFKVCVISNQSGVGKGIYSKKELDRITQNMLRVLKKKKAHLDGVYYCIHKPEDNCLCRKPKTGLLKQALTDFNCQPQVTFFIGDSLSDIETARNFKAISALVLSGREKISSLTRWHLKPDYVFDNLLLASHYICSHYGE